MTTQEVADSLVKLCAEGNFLGAIQTLYSDAIVSVEAGAPPGESREVSGMAAVLGKAEWWSTNHDVHGASVEGPLVAGSHFSVVFKLDVTFKPTGKRFQMEEVAVYQVAGGKIVREEFFYNV
jgi:ketosteroid isomerase-like protein